MRLGLPKQFLNLFWALLQESQNWKACCNK
uniref:Uncharacterized protein n=1 Tax=Rhizophora mucronata TaxID=61149 RepID=A0A2P2KBJ6_RHIMU